MVQASFFEEPLEVVHCSHACRLPIGATVFVSCGLLVVLLAPFLASLGSLLSYLDDNIG
jgi:hypothetical protein